MNILIADDEKSMTNILKIYFEKENFTTFIANDGDEALNIFYENKIDIAILDWMMPKINGIDVCKEIKKISDTKVVMLTAKGENDDEFLALESGTDDYIRKPFDPRILILRVKKLINVESMISFLNFKIDLNGKKLFKDNEDLNLTRREFELLKCFYNNKGKILSRDQLLNLVWGIDYYGDYRTVDTHVHRLRDKIGSELIKTYRGMGYCLEI